MDVQVREKRGIGVESDGRGIRVVGGKKGVKSYISRAILMVKALPSSLIVLWVLWTTISLVNVATNNILPSGELASWNFFSLLSDILNWSLSV